LSNVNQQSPCEAPPSSYEQDQNAAARTPRVFARTVPDYRWDCAPRCIDYAGTDIAAVAPIITFVRLDIVPLRQRMENNTGRAE